jgi:cysteinyl-tRNA synthetase
MADTLPVSLYSTMSRNIELLCPIKPGHVGVYCCGPTVYNYQHIGNLRTYIFEDLLVRTLRYAGYSVEHVMNITDVGHLVSDADEGEDKMTVAVKREGKSSIEISRYYTDIFFKHCALLNISRPTVVCKATEHISEMISLIGRLLERGMAYVAGGNVYFDVARFGGYGRLAKLDLDSLKAGARIQVDSEKRNPSDFALWFTKSKFENQELQWDSPWGRGYPGWHIECSAMSMRYLGESFDIHCGGIDHIPIHHTNEIAQSEGATGKPFAQIWMHGGFLLTNTEKMSKSSGDFLTLDRFSNEGIEPLAYRLFCLGGNYRQELNWSMEGVSGAASALRKLRQSVSKIREEAEGDKPSRSEVHGSYIQAFNEAILNDLGSAKALGILYNMIVDNRLSAGEKFGIISTFDQVLGLGLADWRQVETEIPSDVIALARERESARTQRDFTRADSLRAQIAERGFVVEDGKDGFKIRQAN